MKKIQLKFGEHVGISGGKIQHSSLSDEVRSTKIGWRYVSSSRGPELMVEDKDHFAQLMVILSIGKESAKIAMGEVLSEADRIERDLLDEGASEVLFLSWNDPFVYEGGARGAEAVRGWYAEWECFVFGMSELAYIK